MSILVFFSINGTEITEHNRTYDMSEFQQNSDIETSSGRIKRFYKKNKKVMKISFKYLPSLSSKTVDNRAGRDFLYNIALTSPTVTITYQDEPSGNVKTFTGFINDYSETIVRRDLQGQCTYYDSDLTIEEQ